MPEGNNNNQETNQAEYQEALDLVKNFANNTETSMTKSLKMNEMNILNVKETIYSFDLEEKTIMEQKLLSFSDDKKIENPSEVKVYTFEFEDNGNKGYAISSPDVRINDVLVFVPNGNMADTSYNFGLQIALANIEKVCEYKVKNFSHDDIAIKRGIRPSQMLRILPLTNLEWNQTCPFNQYVPVSYPNIHWWYRGKAYAGCTAIALAQTLAYLFYSGTDRDVKHMTTNHK